MGLRIPDLEVFFSVDGGYFGGGPAVDVPSALEGLGVCGSIGQNGGRQ